MTTRIREYRWLRNLRRMLDVDEGNPGLPGRPSVGLLIQPVLDAAALGRESKVMNNADVSISATGLHTLYTVAEGVREHLRSITFIQGSGTWTVTRLYVFDASEVKNHAVAFYNQVTEGLWEPPGDFVLEETDEIRLLVDAQSVTGPVETTLWVEQEPYGPG